MNRLKSLAPETIFIAVILFIAAFLFFWNIPNTVQFQGDQGRDALIVSNIFKNRDLVFIGPVTSVGNMYLGPLYYYFMLPFMMLSYPSPLGPVYAIGVLALITIYLLFKSVQQLFGIKTAVIATLLYSFSSTVVLYARFSWNPNPAPLVALCMFLCTYFAWTKHPKYWLGVAVAFSILIQLHYLTLLSLGGAGIIWILHLKQTLYVKKSVKELKKLLFYTAGSIGVAILFLIPLILFDIKHEYVNAKAFLGLFTKESVFTGEVEYSLIERLIKLLADIRVRLMHIMYELLIGEHGVRNLLLFITEIAASFFVFKTLSKEQKSAFVVLTVFIVTAVVGTALYKSNVYDHYILYVLPLVVIFHALLLSKIKHHIITTTALSLALVTYVYTNSKTMPLQTIGWTVYDIRNVAETIYDRVKPGEKYNIVLLTETGDIDGQNYRYFLTTTSKPPLPIERRGETETLFIINEDRKLTKVTDSPIYEIVVFPNKVPKEVYTISDGPEITVLQK